MRNKLSTKTVVLVLVLLLVLFAAVVTVSAAELSSSDAAIAKVDVSGAEGLTVGPISSTDHMLISPWGIDATRIGIH